MELKLEHISKEYKNTTALDDFSMTFSEEIYGLLGPNGAGKSTLMKLITRNIKPTAGEIYLDGTDIHTLKREYQRLIGYMPQQQAIYPFYTGRMFLAYMGLLKGVEKKVLNDEIEKYASKVNLLDVLDRKVGTYSGGMKQRLLIAQAFLGDSKIIIFDEPTAGLDPKERIHVRNLIHDNSAGKIILIATHVVQDIEDIASQIMLLKKGVLIEMAAPEILTGRITDKENPDLEDVYLSIFGE
ncbi:ATP-binding cassette domain-containing protein [Coprococcus eutactus]|jgi:ABC-2 type transport system ATP-binding protein|uniref:ABC transporter ATP-binding protein n=1 Tax=Clostridia TaxID=186801 RepID=UPI000338546E|nr:MULTISPECIES: ATP-binding cassette domain-containing protein [Clostridia]RHV81654.1 ATP-binding cassette domain-containing protein [Clostridium sp. OF10-22XD]CCY59932.1 aBC transporter ATP-binding protein [Clostridium sp. CAG:264]SCH11965.1 Lipopolysaccharide export system ATP-binding protein LptB [uncultured Coprococcus sp.]HAB87619.1 ABC transporter ATP-binding protein [Coprococcus sp.]MCB5504317.1 ATP-binding cassette domain-containing protein [Coprococcus eutactus]